VSELLLPLQVDFWVWDSGSPILNATVVRTVVVDKPCPDSSAPYYCQDNSGRKFCSGDAHMPAPVVRSHFECALECNC
jgi:hypothetical protein